MKERAVKFGPRGTLMGIVCEAVQGRDVAVVLLNAGLLHRVGPHRMNVELARCLAEHGYTTLRFDVSGIGDSESVSSANERERAVVDTRLAMSLLHERAGATRFVLLGVCSGAYSVHNTALADERVSGAVMLDGYSFRTSGYYLRHYLPRLSPGRVASFVRRNVVQRLPRATNDGERATIFENYSLAKEQYELELAQLIERQVQMLMVFSGGQQSVNDARQLHEGFGHLDLDRAVEVSYHQDADHLYSLGEQRVRLIHGICDWVSRKF